MMYLAALPKAIRNRVRFIHFNHTNPVLDPTSAAATRVLDAGFRLAVAGEDVIL